ncbi:hypothetical protein N7488_007968 [Penicillium malachiteum]|nr:hypothetical protein N7488_007968 [Penicillium malachiteum]
MKLRSAPPGYFFQPEKPPPNTDPFAAPAGPYFFYGTLSDPAMLHCSRKGVAKGGEEVLLGNVGDVGDVSPHHILDVSAICLLQWAKAPNIDMLRILPNSGSHGRQGSRGDNYPQSGT